MFTEKSKIFVVLAVVSFVGLIILQQSLGYYRIPKFLQDPSKKPSRVRNHRILENAGQPRDKASLKPVGNGYNNDQDIGLKASIDTTQTQKNVVERISSAPSAGKSTANSIKEKHAPASSDKKSNDQNSPGTQATSPSLDKRPRLPKALIIGFSKCGTAALRTFLTIHPDVVSPVLELRYFTEYYSKGLEWYRKQMPPSTKDQLTIEKTPAYIMTNESLQRIHDFDANVKLIVIVRDPIARLQSQYAHTFTHTDPSQIPPFKKWWNEKPDDQRIIHFSYYARYIRQTYNLFPKKQVLVLNEDDMERDPLPVLKEAENFLGLPSAYSDDMFVFNKDKGFHCFNVHSKLFPRVLAMVQINRTTGCLGKEKGREHHEIGHEYLEHLIHVIRPLNEELFELIGKRFQWDNFIKKS